MNSLTSAKLQVPSVCSQGLRPPLFIVGCGRSGTTLLRLMLNAHPDVAISEESHFIYELARRRSIGRWPASLKNPKDWDRFLNYLRKHLFLKRWGISQESLLSRLEDLTERSHASAFGAVFSEYMEKEGKLIWGDKTPFHVQYMLLLDCLFPSAKFIHLVRDGRDVTLSLLTRRWGPRYIALAGYYWKWLVLSGMVSGSILGPDRFRQIRYEDLVIEPESVLRSLCEWLGLKYTNEVLFYYKTDAARNYAKFGGRAKYVAGPPNPNRVNQWESNMSLSCQKSLLRQAGALLAFLEYEVKSLPSVQEKELIAIRSLMKLDTISRIDRKATIKRGGEFKLSLSLMVNRVCRPYHFLYGELEEWARLGVQWQRTVASMIK